MKLLFLLLVAILPPTISIADNTTSISTRYQIMDFDNSAQKIKGERYGLRLDVKREKHRFQLDYEKTDTQTIQPPNPADLKIDKYYLRYGKGLSPKTRINMGVMVIDDSLAPTDGGKIFGVGLRYKNRGFSQFYSDYDQFNVYQTDAQISFKTKVSKASIKTTLLAKYIKLDGKDSNGYSRNAEKDYFTTGIKLNTQYKGLNFGANIFLGKRAFAVMQNGFKVQHHAQEVSNSYGLSVGKKLGKVDLKLKYAHLKTIELPRKNPNVKTDALMLAFKYNL